MRAPNLLITLLSLSFTASGTKAASVLTGGGATVDFHPTAWATVAGGLNSPGFEALILDEFFDQAEANARTGAEILNDEVEGSPSNAGLIFALNGSSVVNLEGRTTQPTTFIYDPANVTAHTGVVGLGGVSRWDVNPLLGGGNLLLGDLTLGFDANRLLAGGSGWALTTNILPAGVAFDLLNVNVTADSTSFSISGDLGLSFEVANFVFKTPADQGKDMGDFRFIASAVPEPAGMLLMLLGAIGLVGRRRR